MRPSGPGKPKMVCYGTKENKGDKGESTVNQQKKNNYPMSNLNWKKRVIAAESGCYLLSESLAKAPLAIAGGWPSLVS